MARRLACILDRSSVASAPAHRPSMSLRAAMRAAPLTLLVAVGSCGGDADPARVTTPPTPGAGTGGFDGVVALPLELEKRPIDRQPGVWLSPDDALLVRLPPVR